MAVLREKSIDTLKLSTRTYNCLRRMEIHTVGEFMDFPIEEWQNIRNVGAKTLQEIMELRIYLELGDAKIISQEENAVMIPQEEEDSDCLSEQLDLGGDIPVERLDLSVRARNALLRSGYELASQVVMLTTEDLFALKNIGRKTVEEIQEMVTVLKSELDVQMREASCLPTAFLDVVVACTSNFGCVYSEVQKTATEIYESYPDSGIEAFVYRLYENEMIRRNVKGMLLSVLETATDDIDREELEEKLPVHLLNTTILHEILLELESEGYIIEREDCYARKFMSITDYVRDMENERTRDILLERLNGVSLQETGEEFGLTRERVRQICVKALQKCPRLEEDRYRSIFDTYLFSEQDFCRIFETSPMAYRYLEMVSSVKSLDKQSLEMALLDNNISESIKERIRKNAERECVIANGVKLPRERAALFTHVVKTACKEKTPFSDLEIYYKIFLEEHGLDQITKLQIDSRTYMNKIAASDYVLWNWNYSLRYYDISARDYDALVSTLQVKQFMNLEISSLKLFRDNPELMAEYDIRDEYELHNLLKKIWDRYGDCQVEFSKMPTMRIGTPDRDQQVMNLLTQYAPISPADLCQIYEEKYGAKSAVAHGTYFKVIEKYFCDGFYVIDSLPLPPEQYLYMSNILVEDFYMLTEVQRLFSREFPEADINLLNAYNLQELGYYVYSAYIVRKTCGNAAEYFRSLLLTDDIVDTNNFPEGILGLYSFTAALYSARHERKIVEYAPRQYINIRRLEQRGVTAEALNDYCTQVERFVDADQYFTITSIRQDGFTHELDELYFDEWFYSSILADDPERFTVRRMGGTRLISRGKRDVQLTAFLEWILEQRGHIEMDDLAELLSERYGIEMRRDKLLTILYESNLYYDSIMDTVYVDYDTYFEEV